MKLNTRKLMSARTLTIFSLVTLLIMLTACGGGSPAPADDGGAAGSSEQSSRQVPTMPAASFAAPTTMIDPTKVAASGAGVTPQPSEGDMVYGGALYAKLCSECHGNKLKGYEGLADPIEVYNLDTAGLADLLRTGGGYGNDHIFGLDKISPESINDLQAYLVSIQQ